MRRARVVACWRGLLLALCIGALSLPFGGCEGGAAGARVVHSERSQYQQIYVVESGGRRCLQFAATHSVQSCVDLRDPPRLLLEYNRAMMAGLFVRPAPARVLMIGLGGGSIPRALRALDAEMRIDVVELDPAIVRIASSHFGFAADARTQVFVEDGREFVNRQQRAGPRYDLVLLDAFDVDYIPDHLMTVEFLHSVREILVPEGAVVANTFANGALHDHEIATYQAVFADLVSASANGNRILLASAALPTMQQMQAHAQRVAAPLERFGVEAAALLQRLQRVPQNDARPLTDRLPASRVGKR